MTLKTPLYALHREAGARFVDFAGWSMPIHYGSQLDEHHAVRRAAGVFDVSHMTVVDFAGSGARDCLARLLANDVNRLEAPGRGLYSLMLNEAGGVVDDLIAYRCGDADYRVVVNAATRAKDLAWIAGVAADFDVVVAERAEAVLLAVQGPAARAAAAALLPPALGDAALALPSFGCVAEGGYFVARTGYTGEDGFEIVCETAPDGARLWAELVERGVSPCGLGARDTLRLEAGLPLYGQDMDDAVSPLEAGLGWTVALAPGREFLGRAAFEAAQAGGVGRRSVGLVLEGRGVMRTGQTVRTRAGEGEVTSGGFGPTLGRSIALARLPAAAEDRTVEVEIRGRGHRARVVRPPFVRRGRVRVKLDHPQ